MEISYGLQADFTEVRMAQVTSYAKPQAINETLHSVSVVAVVSERQGAQLQMHCAKQCDVSTVKQYGMPQ